MKIDTNVFFSLCLTQHPLLLRAYSSLSSGFSPGWWGTLRNTWIEPICCRQCKHYQLQNLSGSTSFNILSEIRRTPPETSNNQLHKRSNYRPTYILYLLQYKILERRTTVQPNLTQNQIEWRFFYLKSEILIKYLVEKTSYQDDFINELQQLLS